MTKVGLPTVEGQFVKLAGEHACRNHVQHWQLRDLVAFDACTNNVFTVFGPTVIQFCPRTKKSCELPTRRVRGGGGGGSTPATTLAVQGGYVATGTDKGELSVNRLRRSHSGATDVEPIFQDTITSSQEVLNHLNLVAEAPGRGAVEGQPAEAARLYAAGNDRVVRCYALHGHRLRPTETLESRVAVNYSAEDPSGKTLVTLGDDNVVHLHHRDSSGHFRGTHSQVRVESKDGTSACGMCASWHPWGNVFATAFQCGQVALWDVRSHKVVARQKAARAVRSVKFSSSPVELLAFAEHQQSFHVVDARNFQARQTAHACSDSTGISGLAFAPHGGALYVGVDGSALQEWRVDSAARHGFSTCQPL